ncbi:MAG: hypothetical protein JSV31_04530 [Desulfobacterales bacterium]|nr:MAG: hypothetical protein JSV31_04530 [Desulfobacterales bacterium]
MGDAFKLFAALGVCLFISTGAFGAESQPPPEGGVLPEIILAAPESSEHQQYLGISGKDTFKIPEIKAEVVIIEIFSMY